MAGKTVGLRNAKHVALFNDGLKLRKRLAQLQREMDEVTANIRKQMGKAGASLDEVNAKLVKVAAKERTKEEGVGTVTLHDGNALDQVRHGSGDKIPEVKVTWASKYTVDDKLALGLKKSMDKAVWDNLFVLPPRKVNRARSYDKTLKTLTPQQQRSVRAAVDVYHEPGKVKW